jgi:hypothetical protein
MVESESRVENPEAKSQWRYAPWLILEVVGAVVLIANGLPIYRKMLYAPNEQIQHYGALLWALAATGLIQVGYWVRYYGRTPILHFDNAFAGHIVLFISRLSFLFATSAFGYIFITGNVDLEISWLRYLVFTLGLFSLFCFVRELEKLGNAMLSGPRPIFVKDDEID